MALTQAAERAALNKIIDYLDEDPKKNIDTIMTLVDKFVPEYVLPSQRRAFDTAIRERNNWYRLMMRIFDLNPEVRTKLLKTLIVDCSVLAWPHQERMREKNQCNIPYAILLDPTSACNLRCTGCWAAEYGHALNLSFEDIDSIICQGKELGCHIYIYTGGEPLVRKDDPHPPVRKAPGLRISVLHQRDPHRRGVLPGDDPRGQLCSRHLRRG